MTGTAVPQTAEEFEELLNDTPRLGAALQDGSFPGLVKDYAQKWAAKNEEMVAQFNEQMQLGWQNFLQDQAQSGFRPAPWAGGFRPGAPEVKGREGRKLRAVNRSKLGMHAAAAQVENQALFNERAMGAAVDDEPYAESFGRFLYSVHKAEKAAAKRGDTDEVTRIQDFKDKLNKAITNAMAERIPSEGGFLVPENLRSEILMVALETAVVRPRAQVIPMDSLRVPLPSIDDTSHASSVYGGVQAFWTEEGASLAASAPTWGRVVLEAKKLTAYTAIPNELLQDTVTPLDMWFNRFFPTAISWFEDVAFISGSGVGEPQGILNAPGAVRVPVNATTGTGTLTFTEVATAFSRCWPAALNNTVWLCAPDVLPQLLQMALAAGGPTGTSVAPPLFLQSYQATGTPGGGNGDGIHYTLMGRPLIVSEKIPALGGTVPGALTLVDLSYYLLGDRQTMQVASSDEYLFGQDMIAYRIIERLDGRFWLQSAITPENGSSSTLSPLVKIDTTATS
jgi:HK97 family phage major capsid protein